MYEWRFYVVWTNLDKYWQGLLLTLQIVGTAIILGLAIGVGVGAGRLSKNFIISKLFAAYVEIFRCSPLLVIIVWGFFCLPVLIKMKLTPVFTGIIILACYGGALYGEAFRAGIQAVPPEQRDAGTSLGLSRVQTFFYIVMPQAFRAMIPPILSFSATIFKESSLLCTIGVMELMLQARMLATLTYRPLETLTFVAVVYFAVIYPITVIVRRIEVRLQQKIERGR